MSKRTVTAEELARPLVSYEEAVATIRAAFAPLPPVRTPLADALGLIVAESVAADINVPGFDNSAMDGYAVVAADTSHAGPESPVTLRLVDDLPAGTAPSAQITTGCAAKIMTGAPLPPGADAVIPWEDTTLDGPAGVVATQRPIASGRNVRPAGEDLSVGAVIASPGDLLTPVHLGVLASIGRTHVLAHPAPVVGVLSTGDEVVSPGTELGPAQVFNCNQTVVAAMVRSNGGRVGMESHIGDDPDAISAWLLEASRTCDLIVTTGGASVGEHDWIRAILEKDGALTLWRVALKPGKPIAFGQFGGTPVLGLPGNPGSAFVGLHVFVMPAMRILAGRSPDPARVNATLASEVRGSPARTQFTRVRLDGDVAHPLPLQSSVVLSNLLPADGFAIVPPGGLATGADVTVELL